jgi:predicted transcriptional regulator
MPRTVINLDPDDKRWLDQQARQRHIPMTELVRQAVNACRVREQSHNKPTLQAALKHTAGIWNRDDGMAYQERLRTEWGRQN